MKYSCGVTDKIRRDLVLKKIDEDDKKDDANDDFGEAFISPIPASFVKTSDGYISVCRFFKQRFFIQSNPVLYFKVSELASLNEDQTGNPTIMIESAKNKTAKTYVSKSDCDHGDDIEDDDYAHATQVKEDSYDDFNDDCRYSDHDSGSDDVAANISMVLP